MTADAKRRLEAIESLEDLGAGFTLATHDLEIRGAGELLGEEQSGQIQEIGFSLYTELLGRAVDSLRAGKEPDLDAPLNTGVEINLHVPALLPDDYVPDVHLRLMLYKRISAAEPGDEQQVRTLAGDLGVAGVVGLCAVVALGTLGGAVAVRVVALLALLVAAPALDAQATGLGGRAIADPGPVPARAQPVTWSFDESTTGAPIAWSSPTSVDPGAAGFLVGFGIETVEVSVSFLGIPFGSFDVTDQLPPDMLQDAAYLAGPAPILLLEEPVVAPPPPDPPALAATLVDKIAV